MNRLSDQRPCDDPAHQERVRLVHLCARLTGDPSAAEDVAQDTLAFAWRNRTTQYDVAGRERWLAAIARHLCRRWVRRQARERALRADGSELDTWPDPRHVGDALERRELVDLLQQALALLPPETRTALLARYVDHASHARIAERLGVSEDAVAMRLTRGKQQLRRVITKDFAAAATSYGLIDGATDTWYPTQLWCPRCGAERLVVQLPPSPAPVAFRCSHCSPDPTVPDFAYQRTNVYFARLLDGRTRPSWILKHTAAWAHAYFQRALERRAADCTHCGRTVPLAPKQSDNLVAQLDDPQFVVVHCPACDTAVSVSLAGVILNVPAVQDFWRTQRRIRRLPVYDVDRNGQPALVARFASITNDAQLVVVAGGAAGTNLEIHVDPRQAMPVGS